MTMDEVRAIKDRSPAGKSGPWVTDFNEMGKKTVMRRHSKRLPLSAEFRDAVDKDFDSLPDITGTVDVGAAPYTKPQAIAEPVSDEPVPAPEADADTVPPPVTEEVVDELVTAIQKAEKENAADPEVFGPDEVMTDAYGKAGLAIDKLVTGKPSQLAKIVATYQKAGWM